VTRKSFGYDDYTGHQPRVTGIGDREVLRTHQNTTYDPNSSYVEQPQIQQVNPFKYNEENILNEICDYIKSTYSQHYVGKNNIQTIDVWESLGSVDTSTRDAALKYLMRYGKKDGYNKKDILKAIHFMILMWHFTQDKE
jgi:hypothetical protein